MYSRQLSQGGNDLRLATPGNDLPQGTDHTIGGQGEIDLDAQGFAVEVINDVEQSKAPVMWDWTPSSTAAQIRGDVAAS